MPNVYDQLFKTLLDQHIEGFLGLTHPDLLTQVDIDRIELRPIEAFVDEKRGTGRDRRPDLVGQLYSPGSLEPAALLHVEIEGQFRRRTSSRVAEYNLLLHLRHRLPVVSIVLFLQGGRPGAHPQRHRIRAFAETIVVVGYRSLGVSRLHAQDYLERREPLAWALAALMRPPPGVSRPEHRLQCLQRIASAALPANQRNSLVNCVVTYLELDGVDASEYEKLLRTNKEVHDMELSAFEKIELRGRVTGKQESLVHLLERRFGEVSETMRGRIAAIDDPMRIDAILERLLDARSLADLKL